MFRQLKIRPKALRDISSAFRWYETEQPGLGLEYLDKLQRALRTISDTPYQYPVIRGRTRRALVERFPYAVYFRVAGATVDVVAVFHTHRDPSSWQVREPSPVYAVTGLAA